MAAFAPSDQAPQRPGRSLLRSPLWLRLPQARRRPIRCRSAHATFHARSFMMETETDLRRHDLLIDGKRLPPGTGEYSIDINPATEEPIALVAQGSAADVDTAVHAARAALKVWNAIRAADR